MTNSVKYFICNKIAFQIMGMDLNQAYSGTVDVKNIQTTGEKSIFQSFWGSRNKLSYLLHE